MNEEIKELEEIQSALARYLEQLEKSNHDLAVLLGRVTYFLEFEQGSPITKRRAMAKKLLDEINKATGGTK